MNSIYCNCIQGRIQDFAWGGTNSGLFAPEKNSPSLSSSGGQRGGNSRPTSIFLIQAPAQDRVFLGGFDNKKILFPHPKCSGGDFFKVPP